MRYFTPELLALLGADDAAVVAAAEAEWERRLATYEEELRQIEPQLPEHIRAFNDLRLHDARVYSLARQGEQLIMVLHKDVPPRQLVILTWTLAEDPMIDRNVLPFETRSEVMDFDYDEFSVARQNGEFLFAQSILFSNGWEVQLRFRDVRFVLAEPLFATPAPASWPQSA